MSQLTLEHRWMKRKSRTDMKSLKNFEGVIFFMKSVYKMEGMLVGVNGGQ